MSERLFIHVLVTDRVTTPRVRSWLMNLPKKVDCEVIEMFNQLVAMGKWKVGNPACIIRVDSDDDKQKLIELLNQKVENDDRIMSYHVWSMKIDRM